MNRYVLIPEDTLRILPPEDGAGAAIEIFCSRTVIYFEIAQLREVCLLHHVRADQTGSWSTRSASPRPTGCWSSRRRCSSRRIARITRPSSQISGIMRRQHSIFPKRRTISRRAATTTGIISNKSCKSCAS